MLISMVNIIIADIICYIIEKCFQTAIAAIFFQYCNMYIHNDETPLKIQNITGVIFMH